MGSIYKTEDSVDPFCDLSIVDKSTINNTSYTETRENHWPTFTPKNVSKNPVIKK